MLEDGTLGDSERSGNVADAGGMVAVLGEVLRCGFDNAGALLFRPRPDGDVALVERRSDAIAGDSRHRVTYGHCSLQEHLIDFNFIFRGKYASVKRRRIRFVTASQSVPGDSKSIYDAIVIGAGHN